RERFPSCAAFIQALIDAAAPSGVIRTRSTSYEFSLGDITATAEVPAVPSSGLYRRQTRVVPTCQTQPAPPSEPLAGYKLLECLGRGTTGEVWRAHDPRGDDRLVRFLVRPAPGEQRENPLEQLQALRHSLLARVEVHPLPQNRVAIVSDAGEASLATR